MWWPVAAQRVTARPATPAAKASYKSKWSRLRCRAIGRLATPAGPAAGHGQHPGAHVQVGERLFAHLPLRLAPAVRRLDAGRFRPGHPPQQRR